VVQEMIGENEFKLVRIETEKAFLSASTNSVLDEQNLKYIDMRA
jgi:hypothetical protein